MHSRMRTCSTDFTRPELVWLLVNHLKVHRRYWPPGQGCAGLAGKVRCPFLHAARVFECLAGKDKGNFHTKSSLQQVIQASGRWARRSAAEKMPVATARIGQASSCAAA